MKIAIKFNDNDFYNTFHGVLETLNNANKWHGGLTTDKEKLAKIINKISYGCYLAYQNQFEYNNEKSGEYDDHTENYLQIKPDQILIDKEVDRYLKFTDWDNGETFILDTDLDYENNEPIFTR